MHGSALAGVTMSVLIRCLSPLGAHGTEWRNERRKGLRPKREGTSSSQQGATKEGRGRRELQVNCDSQKFKVGGEILKFSLMA